MATTATATATAAFDDAAAAYDATFSDTTLGRRYRAAVDASLRRAFAAGDRVLELNCGTGVDARALVQRGVAVVATDASPRMVEIAGARLAAAGARLAAAGAGDRSRAQVLAIEDLAARLPELGRFDGVLSNFGGLNCVADLDGAASAMASALVPGGRAVVCVMGPVVPWEWAWFAAHGDPGRAVRRLRHDVRWRGMPIAYPGVGAAVRAFAPWFTVTRRRGVGALLPPPYTEPWAARHPRLVGALDRAERRVDAWPGVCRVADHYVLELARR